VVPFAYAIHAATAQAIKSWVAKGGFLFSGMWCGAKDGSGFGQYIVPGFGLDEVFGAREARLTPFFSEEDRKITNMFSSFGAQITGRPPFKIVAPLAPDGLAQPGDSFTGFRYVSSLRLTGGEAIALDERGDVTAVRNRFGEGQALMVGTFPIRAEVFAEDGLTRLAHDFAELAGIRRPAVILNRGGHEVEAKLLEGKGKTGLLVLLNTENESFHFDVRLEGRTLRSAMNLETGTSLPLLVEQGHTRVMLTLPASDAAGIYFED
jgi:hypothetical protein